MTALQWAMQPPTAFRKAGQVSGLGGFVANPEEMDGAASRMGITIQSCFLQAPCSAALIDCDHAMWLWMQEAGLDQAG